MSKKSSMAIIRQYELSSRRCEFPRLVCKVRRFPTDVVAVLRYNFATGQFLLDFPCSYTSTEISDELRRFVILVRSPHWRSEIQPFLAPDDFDLPFGYE